MAKKTAAEIVQLPGVQERQEKKERLTQRADGLYQLQVGYMLPDGTRKRKTLYGRTQAEVRQKRRDFERTLDSGVDVSRQRVTVGTYAEDWLRIYKSDVSPNTFKTYRRDVDIIVSKIGSRRLADIRATDVRDVLNVRLGQSGSALKKLRMTMRAIFDCAVADRLITINPAAGVDLPACEDGTHRVITDDERKMILTQCTDDDFHRAMMVMLYAGLRREEVLALNPSTDIDFDRREIVVNKALIFEGNRPVIKEPKSKASIRRVPLLPPLDQEAKKWKKLSLLISTQDGQPMTSSSFRAALDTYTRRMEQLLNGGVQYRWRKKLGEDYVWKEWTVRCHDLRHSFCSMLYDAGVDVKTAQRWMGHASLEVTLKIYTHLSQNKEDTARSLARKHFSKNCSK